MIAGLSGRGATRACLRPWRRFPLSFLIIGLITLLVFSAAQALELPVGEEPESVAINPITNQAVVTHEGSNDLRIIDLSSNTVLTPSR